MITRTARSLLGLNNSLLRFGFCVNKAHLDPFKHTTMNHSPHNMFVDLYDFGEYPEVILPASIAPRTYQPIVVATAVDVFNVRYVFFLFIKRELPWLLKTLTQNWTSHGQDSSKKTLKLKTHWKKFWLQFSTDCPWIFLSEKADGPGSRNKEKDWALLQLTSNLTLQKQSVTFWMPTTPWSSYSYWPHPWVCLLTSHKPLLHWKSITSKKCQTANTKESKNLITFKEPTKTLSTKWWVWFTDCDLFQIN